MRILKTISNTYADGPGIRYSIYVSGCTNQCEDCHNPESWNFNQGEALNNELIAKIKEEILSNPMLTGITISGGDPMHPKNAEGLLYLLKELSVLNKNIWVYTGHTIEEILNSKNKNRINALQYIDILVDGKYKKDLRELSTFRGSSNQRFIKAKDIKFNDSKDSHMEGTITCINMPVL